MMMIQSLFILFGLTFRSLLFLANLLDTFGLNVLALVNQLMQGLLIVLGLFELTIDSRIIHPARVILRGMLRLVIVARWHIHRPDAYIFDHIVFIGKIADVVLIQWVIVVFLSLLLCLLYKAHLRFRKRGDFSEDMDNTAMVRWNHIGTLELFVHLLGDATRPASDLVID